MPALIQAFLDEASSTYTYVVHEADDGPCAIVDSVLNYDPASGRTDTRQADKVIAYVREHRLQVQWLLETQAHALHVPGHTPADMAYLIDDQLILVGDTLFMPDVGTARCDFPGGDAHQLYASMRKLLTFPPHTRLYVCHDYPPQGREARCQTTVAEQRAGNIHVHDGVDEAAFVQMRTQRDAGLGMPTLLLPAIQVNVRAGNMPPPEENGVVYLKIPLNQL